MIGRSPPSNIDDVDLSLAVESVHGIRNHDDDDDDERPRLLNHHVRVVRQRAHHDQTHRDQRYDDDATPRDDATRRVMREYYGLTNDARSYVVYSERDGCERAPRGVFQCVEFAQR